jgi:exoribonuclease R
MNNKKTPFPPKQKQQSLSSSANKAKGAKSFASPTWLAKPEIDLAVKSNKAAYGYFHSARRDVGFVRLSSDARDVFIDGVEARNRAMDGDYVVVEFLPPNASPTKPPLPAAILQFAPPNLTAESNDALWAPKINFPPAAAAPPSPVVVVQQQPQQCGKIVSVVNKDTLVPIRQRETDKEWIGTLNPPPGVVVTNESGRLNASVGYCFFENNDQRFPSLVIQRNNLPFEFVENPESCRNVLYRAKFASWPEDRKFPFGEVVGKIGTRGEIHSETAALLLANKVNTEGFSEEALKCITQHQNGPIWEIPQEEFAKRRDLRNELIFTIDPLTAKDIDDALHCKQIGEGLFEVGVHIADVSHFVPENSAIDAEVGCFFFSRFFPLTR